ncbi:MAG: DUF433 domain-containing protein [Salana multivorans]|uniref:DUF433 domain-containing protein n=1 Tax=Salana multivorans TaxID=120377 RepID=UPI0009675AA9|nr:DUF433 domain-containing protein [Salana multivorans]MBN8883008.1 DUF433 domain-containing protein [Salana multivorans]OJX94102.1 MAG: hypothetical protein BGO96_09545 [Micrococcales bacterium 73-15]
MAYPLALTAALTGVTKSQLLAWRKSGLVAPEVQAKRPPLWSFRDLLLLRSLAYLRAHVSSQKIHKGFRNLHEVQKSEAPDDVEVVFAHPSAYQFGTDGKTIFIGTPSGLAYDLLRGVHEGGVQPLIFSAELMLGEFANWKGAAVAPLATPAPHIQVRPRRMGGWPTIADTRVPFDLIAQLVDYKTVFPEDVTRFYPSVSAEAARAAVEFARHVSGAA